MSGARQARAACLAAVLAVSAASVRAQGITGAALQGTVSDAAGLPLAETIVLATNTASGERWRTATDAGGRFRFERLSVGGPYRVEARAVGYLPAAAEELTLSLGDRQFVRLALRPAALALAPLEVRAPLPRPSGPGRTVDTAQITRLPLLNRDVLSLVRESPQAVGNVGGTSIAGQSPLQNSFQIDGGENGSLYGQFAATPGGLITLISPPGGGGLRTVPLDAVQEVRVEVAPFDVREGNFVGGLVNAVTRSGTNQVHGTLFGVLQNQRLAGRDTGGASLPRFHTLQYGGSAGGPLVRDRLHVFVSGELQSSEMPYAGPLIRADTAGGADSAGVGIRYASATRFQRILRDGYGVEPGGFGPTETGNPAQSLFGKLTLQTGVNGRAELSQSYVHGVDHGFLVTREPNGTYGLTSSDGSIRSTTLATRAAWNTALGRRGAGELIASYLVVHDRCEPLGDFASIAVTTDEGRLAAGWNPLCPGTTLAQHALELTGNVSLGLGPHRLVFGSHDELLAFRDPTSLGHVGEWEFDGLDDLEAARPVTYRRSVGGALRAGPVADFRVRQLGLYAQDEWSAGALVVSLGLRLDLPLFPDRPLTNPGLRASSLAVDTGTFPDGRPLWSPRLGLTYAPGVGRVTWRGGAGLFSGRPAYVLPGDAYRSTGLEQFLVDCSGDDVPDFTLDLAAQPTACRGAEALPVPRITYVDRSFRFPQALKLSAGVDALLPGQVRATVDLLLMRTVHQLDLVDVNLAPTGRRLAGEGGRAMYGTLDPNGQASENRQAPEFASVIRQGNAAGDRYASVAVSLTAPVGRSGSVSAAYSYSEARDRMSVPGGLGISLSGLGVAADEVGGTALDGSLEHRRLARSVYDVPHKVRLSGTLEAPWRTSVSFIYEGASGSPFTYVVDGDINADGFGVERFGQISNDPVYVPTGDVPEADVALVNQDGTPASPAEYARLARYIDREPCLRRSRGALLRRNTCRNPWQSRLDLRLARSTALGTGHAVELSLDLFNVAHLLDRDWGLVRRTADFGLEEVPLVRLAGFDDQRGRGVYQLRLPDRDKADGEASRWRMQLGARYVF